MLEQLLLLYVQLIILVLLLLLLALPVLGSTLLLVNLLGAAGVPRLVVVVLQTALSFPLLLFL